MSEDKTEKYWSEHPDEFRKSIEKLRINDHDINRLQEHGLKSDCWKCKKLFKRYDNGEDVRNDIEEHKKWHKTIGI